MATPGPAPSASASEPTQRPSSAPVASQAGFSPADLPRPLGRYVLLRRLARGGMGEVFLASTTGLEGAERPVVVKLIRREHAGDKSFLARFLDEARVQAQLSHAGVAQVLDAATDELSGEPYVVVEYVDGRSLADLRARCVQTGAKVAWHEAVAVGIMIAEALEYVHDRRDAAGQPLGIVHRDLSPQNVMLSYDGDIKLIDFGTARGHNRRCHTVAGVVFAKPGYVAPEVAGGDPGDGRVDLYALGIMLWEMCAGRRFLQGDAQEHLAAVTRGEKDPLPIAASAGAPAELDEVIAMLTRIDREERYRSGGDAVRALAKILGSAPPLENGERGVRARAKDLMTRMFRDEPARVRRSFAKLVESSRAVVTALRTPVSPRSAMVAGAMNPEDDDLLPGTRYRIKRELGRGASSAVYEAEHADLGLAVALKVLSADRASSADYVDRFRREARALSRLSHEHLVGLRDFGQSADGRLFCVMERCDGMTLDRMMRDRGPLPLREALGIARKILSALAVAHAEGLVHRDVKPENIMVGPDGALKLLDFGLVMAADEVGATEETALSSVTLFGTPEYMAPEQASGAKVDERADLYAVGSVLYELLTGTLPFERDSAVAILEAKVKGSPEHPRERARDRDIPEGVDELVMRAIARHPSLRFGSAREMIAAIDRELDSGKARRRRWVGAVVFAASAAGALAALASFAGRDAALHGYQAATDALGALVSRSPASGESGSSIALADEAVPAELPPPLAAPAPAAPGAATQAGDASASLAPATAAEAQDELHAPPEEPLDAPVDAPSAGPEGVDVGAPVEVATMEASPRAEDTSAEPPAPPKPKKAKPSGTKKKATSDAPRSGRVAKRIKN